VAISSHPVPPALILQPFPAYFQHIKNYYKRVRKLWPKLLPDDCSPYTTCPHQLRDNVRHLVCGDSFGEQRDPCASLVPDDFEKFLEESDADDPKPQDTATSGFAKGTQGFGEFCAEVDKLISENYTYRKLMRSLGPPRPSTWWHARHISGRVRCWRGGWR
jgi:hypothetical protein